MAEKGGVVGVDFYPRYLGGEGLEPVVKHFMHILNVVGEDAPALGSDWDGFIVPTRQLSDPRGLPSSRTLLRAGVTERALSEDLARQRPENLVVDPPSGTVELGVT